RSWTWRRRTAPRRSWRARTRTNGASPTWTSSGPALQAGPGNRAPGTRAMVGFAAMPAFVTLTLNPALDLSTTTERLQPTHKLRCTDAQRFAGGGGINVARVLHRLGADVQAWALAGGL